MMKALRNVDVSNPPRITVAIGLCISLPGKSPRNTNGTKAKADVNAVIKIGFNRSAEPFNTRSRTDKPSSSRK